MLNRLIWFKNINNLSYFNMINFFVETKLEYTTQLVNILTPLIYEGVQSIYAESLKVSNEANNVLKVFQSFLKRIPKWNEEMIKQETERILNSTKSFSWLHDLVKATIKANIIVLTYNPNCLVPPGYKLQTKIDPKFYENIKIEDFIHKIYIECARELWNNPYLMYHQYPAIELKRNQRDTIHLIKDSIKDGIRKLLPVKEILELYLGEELEPNIPNDNFDRNITEADEKNIQKLIRRELTNTNPVTRIENFSNSNLVKLEGQDMLVKLDQREVSNKLDPREVSNKLDPREVSNKLDTHEILNKINTKEPIKTNSQIGGDEKKDLESKILEIINKPSTEDKNNNTSSYVSPKNKSYEKTSELDDSPMTKATKVSSNHTSPKKNDKKNETIDDKIKHILEKNLGETDLNTSLSYRPETNEKDYQEIFSNNVGGGGTDKNEIKNDTKEKDSSKSKRKFFNNYLNF